MTKGFDLINKTAIICSSITFAAIFLLALSANAVEAPETLDVVETTMPTTTSCSATISRMTTSTTSCTTTTENITTMLTTETEVSVEVNTEIVDDPEPIVKEERHEEIIAEIEPTAEPISVEVIEEPIPEPELEIIEVPETEYVELEIIEQPVYCDPADREYLAQIVAHESGSDWISTYNKACVVAVVMNRVNNPQFPNTVYDVLTQPYQFSGFCFGYSPSQSCYDAVDYYFEHQNEFGNILYFYGDGYQNYFY